jgi:hypothetical protein
MPISDQDLSGKSGYRKIDLNDFSDLYLYIFYRARSLLIIADKKVLADQDAWQPPFSGYP